MDRRKSSRVINMKYNYVIISKTQVAEFKNENESKFGYYWGINSLTKDFNIFLKDNEATESFKRTREWILEKYPELLI
jgi:hypothetical protein